MTDIFDKIELLKTSVPAFLESLKGRKVPGYYRYSYAGDLYDDSRHWNCFSSVFALKIFYTLGVSRNSDIEKAAEYIKSFQKYDGTIYDKLIRRKSIPAYLLQALRNRSFSDPFNRSYIISETRQALSSLGLYGLLPKNLPEFFKYSDEKIIKFLGSLDWRFPWSAGSQFSHLMFFLGSACRTGIISRDCYEHFSDTAVNWVNQYQHERDGTWYKGNCSQQQKINGAMKVITGMIAADKIRFDYPERIIDFCLDKISASQACDNFNIVLVINYASKLLDQNYRRQELQDFAFRRLRIYFSHYHEEKGGFSFFPDRANDVYCGVKITKGLNEPDIHGTVLFLWGISVLLQIIGESNRFGLREFKT